MEEILKTGQDILLSYGINFFWSMVILVVGWFLAKRTRHVFRSLLKKARVEESLVPFLSSVIYVTILIFVVMAALNKLGIATTSIVAVLGAAGLAVALSLRNSLSNLAAGVIILTSRPFRVGDFVETAGVMGTVKKMELLHTHLKAPDAKDIFVPNSKMIDGRITNFSMMNARRIDLVIGIAYDADLLKGKEVIKDVLVKEPRVLDDPAPKVQTLELADSSVNFAVRPWVKRADYWDTRCDLTEAIKLRLDAEGISIPFPQRDVHLYAEGPLPKEGQQL